MAAEHPDEPTRRGGRSHSHLTVSSVGLFAVSTIVWVGGAIVHEVLLPLPASIVWGAPVAAVISAIGMGVGWAMDRSQEAHDDTRAHISRENQATRDKLDELLRQHRVWVGEKIEDTLPQAANGSRPPAPVLGISRHHGGRG